jgi:hypothetical protein
MSYQVLLGYTEQLFPDAADVLGKRILYKINGGPGCLDLKLLSNLRARVVWLFNGVQNMTHITQKMDQNYSFFKSLGRRHSQLLLNEQVRNDNDKKGCTFQIWKHMQHQRTYLPWIGVIMDSSYLAEMKRRRIGFVLWNRHSIEHLASK